jgi:hypothetical protein
MGQQKMKLAVPGSVIEEMRHEVEFSLTSSSLRAFSQLRE